MEEDLGTAAPDFDVVPEVRIAALKSVRRCELEIAEIVKKQAGMISGLREKRPDWRAILTRPRDQGGFGEPENDREVEALEEKVAALETLYRNRLSVLTGGAGTGKISVLKAFLIAIREIEGPLATLLAARTGKARVRLQAASGRPASTIQQVLWDVEMLGANFRILEKPKKGQLSYSTVVIDESSMPSVERVW